MSSPPPTTTTPREAKPVMISVDDDPGVSRAVQRDLRRRYGERFRVLRAESGSEGLELLSQVHLREEAVALLVADQRMPRMNGVEFLERARELVPDAKRVLLTAYADTEAAIDAINRVALDHYLMKPWDPPEEQLYPVIDDLLADWQAGVLAEDGIRVVGHRFSRRSHELKDFLARNNVPYRWFDIETSPEGGSLVEAADADPETLPLVVFPDGDVLTAPTNLQVAERVGLTTRADRPFYDLVVVGGGPAGLAAAVYGASEGLRTVLVEREAPGGQAGQSSRIENYLGFPVGLSGGDLARRATAQAQRFGAELLSVSDAVGLEARGPARVLRLAGGDEIAAHAIVIATGVQYRNLDAPGVEELTGRGVYYGGSRAEALACRGRARVHRGGRQLGRTGGAALRRLRRPGHDRPPRHRPAPGDVALSDRPHRRRRQHRRAPGRRDRRGPRGGVAGGAHHRGPGERRARARPGGGDVHLHRGAAATPSGWPAPWPGTSTASSSPGPTCAPRGCVRRGRSSAPPLLLESSLPGVFVAGDVRHQSIKRVAGAVGDGSMSVQFVHQYLGTLA